MFSYTDILKACEYAQLPEKLANELLANLPAKRSSKQNSSLHLFFKKIADALNEQGQTWNYQHLITKQLIEVPFSLELIKEYIWKPIQKTLFGTDSTTKLTTKEINEIVDVINLHFSKNFELTFEFPHNE